MAEPLADNTCRTCDHWDRWLGEHGDCLKHANFRREAMLGDGPIPAPRSADMTHIADSCEDWRARPEGRRRG